MRKTLLFLVRFAALVVMLVVVGTGVLFWRLSIKPLDIEFLIPEVENYVLPAHLGLKLEADSVLLSAAFRRNGLFHISISNLSLLGKGDVLILDVPKIEASYGLSNILTLNYKPLSVSVDNMLLQMILTPEGKLLLQGQKQDEELPEIDKPSVNAAGKNSLIVHDIRQFLRYFLSFRRIHFKETSVIVFDEKNGRRIMVPDLNFLLKRQRFSQYHLSVNTKVMMQRDVMHLNGEALLSMGAQTAGFNLKFDKVNLSRAERVIPLLGGVKLAVQGQIKGILDFGQWGAHWRKAFKEINFTIKAPKKGSVTLPAPLNTVYPVEYLEARGVFSENLESLQIQPIKASLTSGLSADARIDVSNIGTFLDTMDFNKVKTVLNASLKDIPIEEVPTVWPAYLGPDAHEWVKTNLKDGKATNALFMLEFLGAELSDLKGDVDFKDVTVHYLSPMKPVKSSWGKVMLYPDKVEIFAQGGQVENMRLHTANVYLTDLQDDVSRAKIELEASGPVQEVLDLINEKPLKLLEGFDFSPKNVNGEATGQVKLEFPLSENIRISDVKVDVTASVSNGSFNAKDVSLTQGALGLVVNNESLILKGQAQYQDIPLDIKWSEFFIPTKSKPTTRVFEAVGKTDDLFIKQFYEGISDYFIGTVKGKVVYEETKDHTATVKASGDLTDAEIMVYPLSYTKVKGVPAEFEATVSLNKDKSFNKMDASLSADKKALDIQGQVLIDKDKTTIVLNKAKAPGSDFSGQFSFIPQKEINVKLKGKEWLLTEIKNLPYFKEKTVVPALSAQPQAKTIPLIDIDASLDSLTLKTGKPLKQVAVKVNRSDGVWKNFFVFARGAEAFSITLTPETQKVQGLAYNTGDFLERINLTDNFSSGKAKLEAKQDNLGIIRGKITIKNMDLKDPGFVTQALTILGILDAFRGKELHFSKGSVPFEMKPNFIMNITEGAIYGTSLGITFEGLLGPGYLDLTGSVIPAYALNSLPGKIPLIGGLFRDSEHGGLVGANYSIKGPLSTAEVDFHPLSSIAPGILGRLFK